MEYGQPTPTTGLDIDECPFNCNVGYKKVGRACEKPDLGKYINSDGDEVGCNLITNGEFTENSGGLDSNTCPFTCKSGYVKDGRSCRAPGQGKYADISGMEQACDDLYPIVGGTYITPQGGEDQGAACDFTCPEEKVKKADSRRCDDPLLGTYVLTNIQYNCWAPDSDSSTNAADESVAELSRRGGTAWASDQSGVRTAAACKLATCAGTHKALNTAKTACDCVPSHHPDGTDGINCVSNTRDCNPAPNNGKGKQVWGGTAWRTCQITHCDGGHWKSGRACVAVTGRYVSPKQQHGTHSLRWQ